MLQAMATLHPLESQQGGLPSYNEALAQDDSALDDEEILLSPDSRWRRRRLEKVASCSDLIDLGGRQEKRMCVPSESSYQQSIPQPCERVAQSSLSPTCTLLDTPVQLGSSITSVDDIRNPPLLPPRPETLQTIETEPIRTTSCPPPKIVEPGPTGAAQELSAVTNASEGHTGVPRGRQQEVLSEPTELEVDNPSRSDAEERRRRRRAWQDLAFGI
jgi:hypothetical protein